MPRGPQSIRQRALSAGMNPRTVSARIRRGDTMSRALDPALRNAADLAGQKFGRLTVIEEAGRDRQGAKRWLCQCDCGATVDTVTTARLRGGMSTSCGCKQIEAVKRIKIRNRIEYGAASANSLFSSYMGGAKRRGIPWDLSKAEFLNLTRQDCFYCDAEPRQVQHPPNCWGPYVYSGVDRVDNDIGYVASNCVPCYTSCNKLKSNVSRHIIERAYLKLNSGGV